MNKKYKIKTGIILALFSAFLYSFSVIVEKNYVTVMSSESILFLMYFGSGLGLFIIYLFSKKKYKSKENKITKKEIPKIVGIVFCELFASFLIIESLKVMNASLVSLLTIFEIVMTSICSYIIFKNPIKKNEIIAIILMIIGCFILNYDNGVLNRVTISSILVIIACLFWGLSNNITASISTKEPAFFTSIKCSSVSIMYLIICIIKGSTIQSNYILMLFGFFSFGLGILFYALSTKYLGASKSTLVFSFSPIFGVILAFIFYKEELTLKFIISLIIMICALICINVKDKKTN